MNVKKGKISKVVLPEWAEHMQELESKLEAIGTEIKTYHKRENDASAWCTIELIERILNGSYFKEKDVE